VSQTPPVVPSTDPVRTISPADAIPIRTARLVLREFTSADWRAVLGYQNDSAYLAYYPWETRTEPEVRAFVDRFVAWRSEVPRARWQLAITLPGFDDVIGSVGVRLPEPGARVAEIGFDLASPHWGRGYASEAAIAMRDFGFDALGLHRISAHCLAENVASARVLEKIGLRTEGRLREVEYFSGRWWDTLLFGMLATDRTDTRFA
jgi:[ribosomal protein S5]-alanine N-acetyltransferase